MVRWAILVCSVLVLSQASSFAVGQRSSLSGRWVVDGERSAQRFGQRAFRNGVPNTAIVVQERIGALDVAVEASLSSSGAISRAQTQVTRLGDGFGVNGPSEEVRTRAKWYIEGNHLVREQQLQLHRKSNRMWVTIKTYYKRG